MPTDPPVPFRDTDDALDALASIAEAGGLPDARLLDSIEVTSTSEPISGRRRLARRSCASCGRGMPASQPWTRWTVSVSCRACCRPGARCGADPSATRTIDSRSTCISYDGARGWAGCDGCRRRPPPDGCRARTRPRSRRVAARRAAPRHRQDRRGGQRPGRNAHHDRGARPHADPWDDARARRLHGGGASAAARHRDQTGPHRREPRPRRGCPGGLTRAARRAHSARGSGRRSDGPRRMDAVASDAGP